MTNSVRIRTSKPTVARTFDLAIGAIGYEGRARHALNTLRPASDARVALEFEDRQVHEFEPNKNAFEAEQFVCVPATVENVRSTIASWVGSMTPELEKELTIWVDISSLSRPLIATVCYDLWAQARLTESRIRASFTYSHARFSPPLPDYGPIAHKGAVIPEFAGWSQDPATPCAAIFGIGYEVGLALGAVEYLEPAEAWAFRPSGHVHAYDREIDSSNAEFLGDLRPDHVLTYDVRAPLQLIADLESVVYGSLKDRRVVIIPFGLKLFALAACLVALQHFPLVKIWRVSGGKLAEPINRMPNGRISQLDVLFDGSPTTVRAASAYAAYV